MGAAVATNRTGSSAPGVLIYKGRVEGKHSFDTTRVRIAPHVIELGDRAFYDCPNLVEVQLNEGLRLIGKGAFANCNELRRVTMNEGLQLIGKYAFAYCSELRRVTIPSTVTKLSNSAFNSCFKLAEVELNEGLRTIGICAFSGCSALRSVNIPSTVTELNRDTFYSCSSLVDVLLNEGRICAFSGCSNLEKVQINEGLQFIAGGAFRFCKALKSITMPSTITNLGDGAFDGCKNLAEVKLAAMHSLAARTLPNWSSWGGKRLLDKEFFSRSVLNEDLGQLLNIELLDVLSVFEDKSAIRGCPLTTVKISVSWALSERMARLSPMHRLSLGERICDLPDVELMKDGEILACFPVEHGAAAADDDEIDELDFAEVDTTRSLYKILQWIAFHELKESSILIELAVWKSRIDGTACLSREDCRAPIPDTAKSSIMDYCGFTGFLKPSIDGA
ncbi:hypothetical protein THAOC_22254 [Thalassiosira oceanica]|uniref:Uncharacterized protein n=1 Tax=Thalassiosira oceanica TaxID=159749 RepID=K0SGJ0_THAOC|nr:hypothetical protein THAOC_22254 [Thalassiosira oceanica]|eukprot:EJK57677.1 hypothetical protein THAOC_22254 [Thalassiosira oceanica]